MGAWGGGSPSDALIREVRHGRPLAVGLGGDVQPGHCLPQRAAALAGGGHPQRHSGPRCVAVGPWGGGVQTPHLSSGVAKMAMLTNFCPQVNV